MARDGVAQGDVGGGRWGIAIHRQLDRGSKVLGYGPIGGSRGRGNAGWAAVWDVGVY